MNKKPKSQKRLDSKGAVVKEGDVVRLLRVSDNLLRGLELSDIAAINAQVNRTMNIEGFDQYGNAELEFEDENGDFHSIWVSTQDLKKI